MVGVSYHELTAGQKPRHSAGERKQFLVICTIGAAVMFNAFINAGLFEEVVIKDDGIYRGGQYIHKLIEHRWVISQVNICMIYLIVYFEEKIASSFSY